MFLSHAVSMDLLATASLTLFSFRDLHFVSSDAIVYLVSTNLQSVTITEQVITTNK